jgi:hypothetical protein
LVEASDGRIGLWAVHLLDFGLARWHFVLDVWNSLAAIHSQVPAIVLFELCYGVPILMVALVGGLLTMRLWPVGEAGAGSTPISTTDGTDAMNRNTSWGCAASSPLFDFGKARDVQSVLKAYRRHESG